MARISDFNLSAKQLVDFALDRYRKGDIFGSARYVRNALAQNKRSAIAYSVLGCLLSEGNELELANKALYKGLHQSRDYENLHLRRQLALNFLRLNQPEVAMYYTDDREVDIIDALDGMFGFDGDGGPDLYLSYPPSEEYYERMLAKAYELASEGDVDAAMKIIDGIPDDYNELIAKSKLILFTINNDVDSVIEFGERMIKEGKDTSPVRCTLASAYMLKERSKEAYEIAKPLIENPDGELETLLMVLPVAVSLEMHGDIVRLIKLIYDHPRFHSSKRLMIWYSQALYNVGQREAARAVMSDMNALYGEEAPAYYYLKLYAGEPEKVEYNLMLPKDGCLENMSVLRDLMLMDDNELEKFDKTHNAVGDNLDYYVQWALEGNNKTLQNALISRLIYYKRADEVLQNSLVSGELEYGVMNAVIDAFSLLNDGLHPVEFDIVAQDRFKQIRFMPPRALQRMTSTMRTAVLLSIADIIFTDEDPNYFLKRLTSLINGIVDVTTEGKTVYSSKSREKLSLARSSDTLVGVFLSKVYEEDETRESVIERYKLNSKLYDKYYKIVFGEEDD